MGLFSREKPLSIGPDAAEAQPDAKQETGAEAVESTSKVDRPESRSLQDIHMSGKQNVEKGKAWVGKTAKRFGGWLGKLGGGLLSAGKIGAKYAGIGLRAGAEFVASAPAAISEANRRIETNVQSVDRRVKDAIRNAPEAAYNKFESLVDGAKEQLDALNIRAENAVGTLAENISAIADKVRGRIAQWKEQRAANRETEAAAERAEEYQSLINMREGINGRLQELEAQNGLPVASNVERFPSASMDDQESMAAAA